MNKECCIDGCDQPGTIHANHDGADVYCFVHGHCKYCEEPVTYFVLAVDLKRWICPCVAKGRFEEIQRPNYETPGIEEVATNTIVDFWSKSA